MNMNDTNPINPIDQTNQTNPTNQASQRKPNWVLITTAVAGGVVLVGGVAAAAIAGFASVASPAATQGGQNSVHVSKMQKLEIDSSATDYTLACDSSSGSPANDAVLTVGEGMQVWTMHLDGETLQVTPERGLFGWFRNFAP
ncbi:MAG: hypothetical protein GX862_03610, partial [Leucobacter sp.]|nr:hypothetical protein [Leucobacter sp.]